MKFITEQQREQLLINSAPENREKDHFPVVKIFMPATDCIWLLTELEAEQPTIAFGLCDLGMGFPELGYVDLEEISEVKNSLGLGIEADQNFKAIYPLSVYAKAAKEYGLVVESEHTLKQFRPPNFLTKLLTFF